MDFQEFVRAVATRTNLSREEAADLSRATLELLARMLTPGQALDLTLELPDELRESVRRGAEARERFDFQEAVYRVHRRTGLSESESDAGIRAVLTTLREAVSEEGFKHATAQIAHEFLEVIQ